MVITGKTEPWDLSLAKVARRIREIGDGVHETLPGKRVHQFEGTDTPTMPHVATVDRGTVNTQQALDEFLLERRLSNRAPATLEQDSWAVRHLLPFCPALPATPLQVAQAIGEPGLSDESRCDIWRCVNKFLKWVENRKGLPNPCRCMEPPPAPENVRRVLSVQEVDQLINSVKTDRDRALVLLPLDTGIRLKEVLNLGIGDIKDGHIIVHGKGKKERSVPIRKDIRDLALQVLTDAGGTWPGRWGPLTKSGLQQVYPRLFKKAGIFTKKNGAHCLRHTFATGYIRKGGGVRHLQTIMGHQNIATTMIYVTLAGVDVERDHALHTPSLDYWTPRGADSGIHFAIPAGPVTEGVPLAPGFLVGTDGSSVCIKLRTLATGLVAETSVVARLGPEDLDRLIAELGEQRRKLSEAHNENQRTS